MAAIEFETARLRLRQWRDADRAPFAVAPDGRFEHPAVPVGNALREHLLYRLSRERWQALPAQQGQ
ncbi:hypothetical protein ACSFA8_10930 [Variovorax sp. RT4R15]|uniref:hypothetical protein n=1 Tax=Variovorax sp. RT4R15 TaxID=3443737 RepID=UPI003F462A70